MTQDVTSQLGVERKCSGPRGQQQAPKGAPRTRPRLSAGDTKELQSGACLPWPETSSGAWTEAVRLQTIEQRSDAHWMTPQSLSQSTHNSRPSKEHKPRVTEKGKES